MLRQVLEDAGYEVEEAPDGLEGIRLYYSSNLSKWKRC